MGITFSKYNIQGHNWPEGVRFPPIELAVTKRKGKKDAKPKQPKAKAKATADIKGKQKARPKEYPDVDDDDYDIAMWDEDGQGHSDSDSAGGEDKPKDKHRSVGTLPLVDLYLIGRALCDEHHPLRFVIYDEGGSDGKSEF